MIQFPCAECGMLIKAPDGGRGDAIVCSNCNTRQIIPADAMPALGTETLPAIPAAPRRDPAPPAYTFLKIAAWVLTALGLIGCALFLILAVAAMGDVPRSSPLAALPLLVSAATSFVAAGLGQAMLALRDIARSTWRLCHPPLPT